MNSQANSKPATAGRTPSPEANKTSPESAADATKSPDTKPADRSTRIAEAAYRRAQVRNFEPGGELEDWLSAEREIDGH